MPELSTELKNSYARLHRQHSAQISRLAQEIAELKALLAGVGGRPPTVQEEIDAIEGRRIESTISAEVTFTLDNDGDVGTPLRFEVSQDGPFVMTHYPLAVWRPTAPDDANNFGRWRPVNSAQLPTQQVTTNFVDLMYQLFDAGPARYLTTGPRILMSRFDNIVPCPIPTLFSSSSVVRFEPTYTAILFEASDDDPAPTQGTLHVDLIGYKIVNL